MKAIDTACAMIAGFAFGSMLLHINGHWEACATIVLGIGLLRDTLRPVL